MATLLTDITAAQAASGVRNSLLDADKVTPRLFHATATYTCTGTEQAGDVINILTLPVGATVLADLSKVISEGTGGTGTAISKIGDAGDDDRYTVTSIAVASAAISPVTAITTQVLAPYKIAAGNETLKATVALSSGSATAGKRIVFRIAYILP